MSEFGYISSKMRVFIHEVFLSCASSICLYNPNRQFDIDCLKLTIHVIISRSREKNDLNRIDWTEDCIEYELDKTVYVDTAETWYD